MRIDKLLSAEQIRSLFSDEDCQDNLSLLLELAVEKDAANAATIVARLMGHTLIQAKETVSLHRNATYEVICLSQFPAEDFDGEKYVPLVVRAAMAHFPDGTSKGNYCTAEQKFFAVFVQKLKEAREKLVDTFWATEITICNDYLKMVLEKNP